MSDPLYDPMQRAVDWFSRSCTQDVIDTLRFGAEGGVTKDPEDILLQAITEKYEMEATEKLVIQLYRAGFTQEEIMAKCDRSKNWVRARLKKGKKHFR